MTQLQPKAPNYWHQLLVSIGWSVLNWVERTLPFRVWSASIIKYGCRSCTTFRLPSFSSQRVTRKRELGPSADVSSIWTFCSITVHWPCPFICAKCWDSGQNKIPSSHCFINKMKDFVFNSESYTKES